MFMAGPGEIHEGSNLWNCPDAGARVPQEKFSTKCIHNCSAELESYITINIYHRAHLDEWQSMRGRGWKRFDSFMKGSISVLIK